MLLKNAFQKEQNFNEQGLWLPIFCLKNIEDIEKFYTYLLKYGYLRNWEIVYGNKN